MHTHGCTSIHWNILTMMMIHSFAYRYSLNECLLLVTSVISRMVHTTHIHIQFTEWIGQSRQELGIPRSLDGKGS